LTELRERGSLENVLREQSIDAHKRYGSSELVEITALSGPVLSRLTTSAEQRRVSETVAPSAPLRLGP